MAEIDGIYAPVLTPFTESGDLDVDALLFNIDKQLTAGLAGIVLFGSSGEFPSLSLSEREQILERVLQAVPAQQVIVQVGSLNERETLKLAERSAAGGVVALLAITPHYFLGSITTAVLREHFARLGSIWPTLVYHIPQNTGLALQGSVVAGLGEIDGVVGMKDSSGNGTFMTDVCSLAPEGFRYLTGSGQGLCSAHAVGAAGGILALADVAPAQCARIWNLLRAGQAAEARALEKRLTPLNDAIGRGYGIAGLKEAARLRGYRAGLPRRPLLPISAEGMKALEAILAAAGE